VTLLLLTHITITAVGYVHKDIKGDNVMIKVTETGAMAVFGKYLLNQRSSISHII
jgi:hypothetical protein